MCLTNRSSGLAQKAVSAAELCRSSRPRAVGRNVVAGLMSVTSPAQRRGRTAGYTRRDHCANKFAQVAQVIRRPRYAAQARAPGKGGRGL